MRIGAGLTPVGDIAAVLDGARAAEAERLDAVALWDHYQSGQPEWQYVAGWAAWGAVAAATRSVRLVPMVVNLLHHDLGRIAKETATLAQLSGGRFELGIGAGDWPASFAAWGRPFPRADDRLALLEESIAALRLVWTGSPVTFAGERIRLQGATVTPAPAVPPRVVVGAGGSRRVAARAATFADEVNVYPEAPLVAAARDSMAAAGRSLPLSVHVDWSWERWPDDVPGALAAIQALGVDGAFVALGAADLAERVGALARAARASGIIGR